MPRSLHTPYSIKPSIFGVSTQLRAIEGKRRIYLNSQFICGQDRRHVRSLPLIVTPRGHEYN
jgi:hypothetical protein